MAHIDEDQAVDLLHGFLAAEESDQAFEHLKRCPVCEELFRRLAGDRERALVEAERHLPELDEQAAARIALPARRVSFFDRMRESFGRRGGLAPRLGLALVAAAALVALVLWPRLAPHREADHLRVAIHQLPPVGELIPSRGEGDPYSDELVAGLAAYSRDDLALSVLLLEKAKVTGQLEMLRRLYLGSALARRGEYSRAVRILRNLPTTELPDPWNLEARWTLFVALRGSGETTAADSLLVVLRKDSGELGARRGQSGSYEPSRGPVPGAAR
ncbi:MAG: hypothetical protein U0527_15625 [Candidatus Eisenbacteria bacterium]